MTAVELGAILALGMLAMVYAIAFGWSPPRIASRDVGDEPLLDFEEAHKPFSGTVAVLVATETLSGLGPEGLLLGAIFVLGVAIFITDRLACFKEVSFGLLGLVAGVIAFQEVLAGACGDYLPTTTARTMALAPVAAMLGSWVVLRAPNFWPKNLGWLMLAVPAMIQIGAIAVFPAGLPLLDEALPLQRAWVPVALIVLLSVIAVGCAIHPRAGADLAAIGLLTLTLFFSHFDTPCGVSFFDFASITFIFAFGAAFGRAVRRRRRR